MWGAFKDPWPVPQDQDVCLPQEAPWKAKSTSLRFAAAKQFELRGNKGRSAQWVSDVLSRTPEKSSMRLRIFRRRSFVHLAGIASFLCDIGLLHVNTGQLL